MGQLFPASLPAERSKFWLCLECFYCQNVLQQSVRRSHPDKMRGASVDISQEPRSAHNFLTGWDCFVIFIKLIKSTAHVSSCRDTVWFKWILCTLTQQITCLASNKQSQILCFEKKGQFQPRFLPPLLGFILTCSNCNFNQKSTLFHPLNFVRTVMGCFVHFWDQTWRQIVCRWQYFGVFSISQTV